MTITDPLPTTQYGKADWVDYQHNWRDDDAEWLMYRSILRYEDAPKRELSLGATPEKGIVTYNNASDRLELRTKANTWLTIEPLPVNLDVLFDTPSEVTIAHQATTTGVALVYTPTEIKLTGPVNVLNSTVRITAAGILFGPDPGKATLSYNGTSVTVDKPYEIPKLTLTGTGTVLDASVAGQEVKAHTLTATQMTTTNATVNSALSATTLDGVSGTIGGVNMATNKVTASGGYGFTPGNFRSALAGTGNTTTLQVPTDKTAKIEMIDDLIMVYGTAGVALHTDMRVQNKTISWYDSGNTKRGDYAVAFYQTGTPTPDPSLYPEGTIWFS